MGERRFFVARHWDGFDSTYKVNKIIAALNDSQVPRSDVVEVVVCPPPLSESLVQSSLRGDFQVATEIRGTNYCQIFTWELDAETVFKSGIPWVIIGHSNTRLLRHDSDKIVGDKVAYTCRYGLKVIACVGETIKQWEAGCTMNVVTAQTKAIAERVSNWENIVLAYNPSGPAVTASQAQQVHAGLRSWLYANISPEVASTTRIICGGSVCDGDWEELAIQPDVDGFMVDGPPLKEFIDVIKLAEKKG